MTILATNRTELKGVFQENLEGLVSDKRVKEYLVTLLDEFVSERELPIDDELPDSVVIANLFEQNRLGELILRGDAYLFLTSWFPGYTTARHRMGFAFYKEKGKESYSYALNLLTSRKAIGDISILYMLTRDFDDNVKILCNVKHKLADNFSELKDEGFSQELLNRMKKRNMRLITS